MGEFPNTIQLYDQIADPNINRTFKWEGCMFDVPGGKAARRVAIVAGADQISDQTLTAQIGNQGPTVDQVVGFAGVYPNSAIPLGPVVQTGQGCWYYAYYITKETPKAPTNGKPLPNVANVASAFDDNAGLDNPPTEDTTNLTYDQAMDQNLGDDVIVGADSWGGQVFGFNIDPEIEVSKEDAPLGTYNDSALKELEASLEHAENAEQAHG
ncbi:hypothetical protein E8E12_008260 [Didymella heteroderae]|uniref:Uncharacterized protein n=1 Tax=Didymella heteroderae TaxID=1769908 RepID=A0A9P4WPU7_9PLEO|nr:hypothetical protein E8E12_008260 [Didymella heteroderae]